MKKLKALLFVACILSSTLFVPLSVASFSRDVDILCYNNGIERHIKISQEEAEYISEKLNEIGRYGISSAEGVSITRELTSYLRERNIIDIPLFSPNIEPKNKTLCIPLNILCHVYAIDAHEGYDGALFAFPPVLLLTFCLIVALLELIDPNSIIGNILLLVGDAIALKASTDQTYIFSNLIVFGALGASITTNGLLGNVFFWGIALLLGFTGIKVKNELFGFCLVATGLY